MVDRAVAADSMTGAWDSPALVVLRTSRLADDPADADWGRSGLEGEAVLVGAVWQEPHSMEREDRPTEESPPGPECGEDERLLLQFHASASAGGGLVQGSGS
jgi:hypothetical protein